MIRIAVCDDNSDFLKIAVSMMRSGQNKEV